MASAIGRLRTNVRNNAIGATPAGIMAPSWAPTSGSNGASTGAIRAPVVVLVSLVAIDDLRVGARTRFDFRSTPLSVAVRFPKRQGSAGAYHEGHHTAVLHSPARPSRPRLARRAADH